MADDKADDAGDGAPSKKGKLKLIIMIAGAVIAALGVGAVVYSMLGGHGAITGEHYAEKKDAKPPSFVDVPEVLVNLTNAPGERVQYLKVKIVLEVSDRSIVDKVKPVMPRVMDLFQTYLRELRPSDLSGSAGLYRLREELTRRVNAAVAPNKIIAVLFKEVVVQ